MSKEFSSNCKHSQNKLSFTSLCLCGRCKCPHASCLPRDKLCQHISTIFQPFSAFSIPHSNSNHLVSPFPRVLHLSKHSSCTSLLSLSMVFLEITLHIRHQTAQSQYSFLLTGNVSQNKKNVDVPSELLTATGRTQKFI